MVISISYQLLVTIYRLHNNNNALACLLSSFFTGMLFTVLKIAPVQYKIGHSNLCAKPFYIANKVDHDDKRYAVVKAIGV